MQNTVKYLKQFVTLEMMKTSLEDLAKAYQLTYDERLISALFIKLMPTTKLITSKYTSVTAEESVSFILQLITDIASSFDVEQKTKFTTYYSRCLERLMYGLLKPHLYQKRVCPTEEISFDEPAYKSGVNASNATVADVTPDRQHDSYSRDLELFDSLHNTFDKQTAEILICIAQGYSRPETADQLNIPLREVYSAINKNKAALALILK